VTYELLLGDRTVVSWQGRDGVDAAVRYADAHPGVTVLAWREPRVQLRAGYAGLAD
jgi:hypothetical protein